MKTSSIFMGVILWLLGSVLAWAQPPLSVAEVGQRVGQNVVAAGTVKRVELQKDGNVRISFEEANEPNGFSVLIVKGTGLDGDPRLSFLPKQPLEVKGKVELDQGRPEIKVTSRDQLAKGSSRRP